MTSTYQQSGTEIPRIESFSQGSTEDTQTNILERLETLANQTGQLRSDVQDRPLKYTTQLRDLGDDEYRLAEPILITIEEYLGEDAVVASFPEIEVFGEGVTESEAIMNLKWAILDLYEELTESPIAELGRLPKNWLSVMQKLIQKD